MSLHGPVEGTAPPLTADEERAKSLTYKFELRRAISGGVLETATTTFLLLIAVRHFEAGATAKALLVTSTPLGLILSPFAVALTRGLKWTAAQSAAVLMLLGACAFLVAALVVTEWLFVTFAMLGVMSGSMAIPMVTQIYQNNYPARERGDLFSRTVMVKVFAAAVSAWLGGMWLEQRMDLYRGMMVVFAIASASGAMWIARCPSVRLAGGASANPLHGLRHIKTDPLFRWLLISWMLMGFGNLLMLPLRVEFLANPRYGINASPATVAWVVSMIPSLTNFCVARMWGRLFDRINFFVLRISLNLFFVCAIFSFFIMRGMVGFAIGGFLFGMANSGGNLAWSLWVTKVAKPELVADYMGVHSMLTGVRGVIAPFLAFYLIEIVAVSVLAWWALGSILIASTILLPEARSLKRRRPANPVTPRPGGMH